MALLIRNREDLKRHLENRLDVLTGEYRRIGVGSSFTEIARAQGIYMRMEGIREALEMIKAWEQYERETP